jgi:hypothetical protein
MFAATSGCHLIVNGLLTFPNSWDALMYHIPFIDHWLQARSLYTPCCPLWSHPGNNEAFTIWIVSPFSGDFLITLGNVPSLLILVYGTLELVRALGLQPLMSHLITLAVVFNTVTMRQLVDVGNDVAVAAFFLAAVSYGVRYLLRANAFNFTYITAPV